MQRMAFAASADEQQIASLTGLGVLTQVQDERVHGAHGISGPGAISRGEYFQL